MEALWDVDWDRTDIDPQNDFFSVNLFLMYSLEYKKHMLENHLFRGMPQRKENILNQINERLSNSTTYVQGILLKTLDKWLASHTILEPKRWADARVRDIEEGDSDSSVVENILYEFIRYKEKSAFRLSQEQQYRKMIKYIQYHINNFPLLKEYLIDIFKQDYNAHLSSDTDDFLQSYNLETEEDAEKFIENLTFDDIGYNLDTLMPDIESFRNVINNHDILVELYEKLVFPLWYGYWQAQGIDDTRETIENIYENLKKVNKSNLKQLISWTNVALNSVHQNGSMMDYVEELVGENYLKRLLNDLSSDIYHEEWNKQLQEVGVVI